jgi:hypothetical protein
MAGHTFNKRRWIKREIAVGITVPTCCAVFISIMTRDSFGITLLYSFCVGIFIQSLVEIGRFGFSHLLRKRAPDSRELQFNWPGWPLMGPWIMVSGVVGYIAGHALGNALTGLHRMPDLIQHPRILFLVMTMVFGVSLGCVYFFYSRSRMAAIELHAQAATRAAAENQLKMLESQLEPHMLFNTLANLRVLIVLDPPRAQAMLDRIISFLRATLEASRVGSHPLSAEFARIGDYLEMMRVRMDERLRFRLDLPAYLAAVPVPPLLLQPLVENAIKHGLEPKVEGGRVDVSARREGETLILSVRDTGLGMSTPPANGTRFGMQQVRERLKALYGDAAALELAPASDEEGGMLAVVRMPVSPASPNKSPQ